MNKVDLLKKLIALANNNPNENEANLAARKVCRLLIELKVNFKSKVDPTIKPVTTWNDVTRSTEPEFKSHKPTSSGPRNPFDDLFNRDIKYWDEFFRHRDKAQKDAYYNQREPKEYKVPDYVKYDPSPFTEPEKPKKEKRPINCTKCGKEFMSGYIGNLFICHQCHWDEYNKSKESV